MDGGRAPLIQNDAANWADHEPRPNDVASPAGQRVPAGGPAHRITCAVCQTPFEIVNSGGLGTCPSCNEKTPTGPPPMGKRYTRCQCNCLMLHSATAGAITCPRPHCRRTTIVGPPPPGKGRGLCPRCDRLIQWPIRARGGIVRCPQCRGSCIVNHRRLLNRLWFNLVIGFILAAVGVGITVGTEVAAEKRGGGVFFVMTGLIVGGIVDMLYAAYYGVKLIAVPRVKPDPMDDSVGP